MTTVTNISGAFARVGSGDEIRRDAGRLTGPSSAAIIHIWETS